jgi:ribonucleotide monophosphatase NagD (HAD superfamily)
MPVIVDIDGTLLRNGTEPIRRVIEYVNSLHGPIWIVTGRVSSDRAKTASALRAVGVHWSRLLMNPYSTQDTLKWKREVANRSKSADLAIDNDPSARAIYSSVGIPTKDPATI